MSSCILAALFGWLEKNTIFDELVYASPYRRIFYVIPGMLLAQIYIFNKDMTTPKSSFENISLLSAIIWFFLRNITKQYFSWYVYAIDMVITCCMIYALAIENGFFSKMLSSKVMVYLGSISMYIFLSHYNIRMYVDYIVRTMNCESLMVGMIEVACILIFTFLISSSIHHYRKI